MKLQNRFNDKVRAAWVFWNKCMVCGENNWDSLHHIISPTSENYIKGKHNESAYNSCPIHNFKCHLYNEEIKKRESELLIKTFQALESEEYKPTELDKRFLNKYKDLYVRPN